VVNVNNRYQNFVVFDFGNDSVISNTITPITF